MRRGAAFLVLLVLSVGKLTGQAIQRRHLVIGYGAGLGATTLDSSTEVLRSPYRRAGSIRFNVSYAAGDRFAFGYSFERLGSTEHPGLLDRYRISTHQVQVIVRPLVRERSWMEFAVGIGPSVSVLSPRGARLQARTSAGHAGAELSWTRMLSSTLGLRFNTAIGTASPGGLTLEGAPVNDERGEQVSVGWTAVRGGLGLIVRF
ncbi:MAG: hypothetical protein R2817_02530 [Flavobacteriales bacterium]